MKIFDGIRNPLVLLMSLIFCVTSSGCNTDYNTMLEEYNGCYEVKTVSNPAPSIGDSGFDQYKMISQDVYYVPYGRSFILSAPDGGTAYEWTLEGGKYKSDHIVGTSRFLECPADFTVSLGISYQLTLLVKHTSNRTYIDKATIIFVD